MKGLNSSGIEKKNGFIFTLHLAPQPFSNVLINNINNNTKKNAPYVALLRIINCNVYPENLLT